MTAYEFERALEIFRTNVQSGAQYFYAYLAVHAVAGQHKDVYRLLNKTPLFWNTSLGALQTATFINLHRVFDGASRHNLNALLDLADHNRHIFPPRAILTSADFCRLRRHAKKWSDVYDKCYRDIRNKIFAHAVLTDDDAIHALMAKTKILDLERLFTSLLSLEKALWYLLKNGHKPVLHRGSYSMLRMLARPRSYRDRSAQERVVFEAKRLLLGAAEATKPKRKA